MPFKVFLIGLLEWCILEFRTSLGPGATACALKVSPGISVSVFFNRRTSPAFVAIWLPDPSRVLLMVFSQW